MYQIYLKTMWVCIRWKVRGGVQGGMPSLTTVLLGCDDSPDEYTQSCSRPVILENFQNRWQCLASNQQCARGGRKDTDMFCHPHPSKTTARSPLKLKQELEPRGALADKSCIRGHSRHTVGQYVPQYVLHKSRFLPSAFFLFAIGKTTNTFKPNGF